MVSSINGATLSKPQFSGNSSSIRIRTFSEQKSQPLHVPLKAGVSQNYNVNGKPGQFNSALKSVIVQSKTGHGVKIDLIDHEFSENIIKNADYETKTNTLIAAYLSGKITGDLIVDAGASVGDTTLWLAKLAKLKNPNARVIAVDPKPENLDFINKMAKKNNINNIVTVHGALGDESRDVSLYQSPAGKDNSGSDYVDFRQRNHTPVLLGGNKFHMYTLDELLTHLGEAHSNVGFLHYDMEGWELEALIGSKRVLQESSPDMTLELNNCSYEAGRLGYDGTFSPGRNGHYSEKMDIITKHAKGYLESMGYKLVQSRLENGNAYFTKRK
tara:strand:- start:1653 stop:2636 length:984 start_codon:yes stop_codon:yes gene_type:complete